MYSAYKLNRQGDNIQPWRTLFPIWNHSVVPCPVLTVASWPAHRFLRRQVRWSGILISFRIFHSLLWSTQSKARSFTFIFPSMIYMIQMYVRNVWRQEFEYWNKTSKKTKNMGLPKFSSSTPTPRTATGAFHTQRAKLHFSVCPLRLGYRLPLHSVIRSLTSSTDCFSTSIFLSNSLSLVLSILQWPPSVSSSSSQLYKIPILQSHHFQDNPSIPFNCFLYLIKWFFSKPELCSSAACTPTALSNMCTAIQVQAQPASASFHRAARVLALASKTGIN